MSHGIIVYGYSWGTTRVASVEEDIQDFIGFGSTGRGTSLDSDHMVNNIVTSWKRLEDIQGIPNHCSYNNKNLLA